MGDWNNVNPSDFDALKLKVSHLLRNVDCLASKDEFGITTLSPPVDAPGPNDPDVLINITTGIIYYWDGDSWEVYSSGGGGGAEFYFEGTYSETSSAAGANLLIPGATYKITDRGDRGIYLNAISTSQFALDGIRVMLVPFTYDFDVSLIPMEGLWHPNLSGSLPSPGVYTAYAGFVYQNINGNIGPPTDLDDPYAPLDPVEWTLISKSSFSSGEYVEKIFGIHYDFLNDWIAKQWDNNGNEIGHPFDGPGTNPVDYTDWNIETRVLLYTSFKNNKSLGAICGNSGSIGGGDTVIENNQIYSSYNGIVGNYADGDVNIKDNICNNIIKNGSGTTLYIKIYSNIITSIDEYESIQYNDGTGGLRIANNKTGFISDNIAAGPTLDINNNIMSGAITNNSGNITSIRDNRVQGDITANTTAEIVYNLVLQGNISDNSNDAGIYDNLILDSGITANSNGGSIIDNVVSYIGSNSFNGPIESNIIQGSIEANYGGTQISYNKNSGTISNNSSTILYNSNLGIIDSNLSDTISYNTNNGDIAGNNNPGVISNNNNNGRIANNVHDGNITNNSNNGSIENCAGAGGFHVTYNINNGSIINPVGLAAADVTDTIVNK